MSTNATARRLAHIALHCCACSAVLASAVVPQAAGSSASERSRRRKTRCKALAAAVDSKEHVDELLAIFGPDGKELIDVVRSRRPRAGTARCSPSPPPSNGVSRIRRRDRQDARHRQRGVAVPGAAREGRERMALRYRRRKEEVIARRIGRNELAAIEICPDLCRGAAALRAHGTRRQARRALRRRVPQRSGQAERSVLAGSRGQKRSPLGDLVAQAAEQERLDIGRRQAAAVPWLLLQDPDRAGSSRNRRRQELRRQGRDVRTASRSSHGRRSTTSPAS